VVSKLPADEMSVLVNVSEKLLKLCSGTVTACAQNIFDKIPTVVEEVDPKIRYCCIFLAACVFSSNINDIEKIVNAYCGEEKITICSKIMVLIKDQII
jgi:hypothetical protein